jgi:transcription-repair coupling factor (superfamily II helicase)
MIGEAVADFKGERQASPAELKLELPVDAHIPATYVDSDRLRLEAYHKLSAASNASNTRADLDVILTSCRTATGWLRKASSTSSTSRSFANRPTG